MQNLPKLPFYLYNENAIFSKTIIESRHFYEAPKSLLPLSLRLAEARYRTLPAVATSPTLKSRSLHLDASILISFHAIFLLLISIHEIHPCATAVAGAIGDRERKRERENGCLFLSRRPCHAFFSRDAYGRSIMPLFSSRPHNANL